MELWGCSFSQEVVRLGSRRACEISGGARGETDRRTTLAQLRNVPLTLMTTSYLGLNRKLSLFRWEEEEQALRKLLSQKDTMSEHTKQIRKEEGRTSTGPSHGFGGRQDEV